jgi:hypothetical protein
LEQNKKELTLEEAKANFKAAIMEFDPVRIIKRKPLHVLGAMAFAGLMMGLTGKKMFRLFSPGPSLISGILKKLI